MNIANQILFAVVITSVTGTAAYGLWRLLMNSRFCTKPQYVYLALFLVCLLYLIPLDYGWMQMTIHGYLQKEGIWQINIFGKTIEELVEDGIRSKLYQIGEESQVKLQDTMQKIVNDSKGGLVCIII